jgi:hypothetical protein
MGAFEEWARLQAAAIGQALRETGRDIVADVGDTYQSFLMADANWRVPRAHDDFMTTAEVEEAIAAREQGAEPQEPEPSPPDLSMEVG